MDIQNYILGKLKKFKDQAFNGVQAITNPLPPPVNVLQNFQPQNQRQAQAYQQAQPYIQDAQRLTDRSTVENVLRNAPAELPRFDFAKNVNNPIGRFAATIPQEFLNAPRDVFAGSLGLGSNIADIAYGKTPVNPLGNIGTLGAGFMNAYTPGPVKGLIGATGKVALKDIALQGAKQGAKIGAISGGFYGLQEGSTPQEQLKNALKQGLTGAVIGGVAGGAIPVVTDAWKKGKISAGMSIKNVGKKPSLGQTNKAPKDIGENVDPNGLKTENFANLQDIQAREGNQMSKQEAEALVASLKGTTQIADSTNQTNTGTLSPRSILKSDIALDTPSRGTPPTPKLSPKASSTPFYNTNRINTSAKGRKAIQQVVQDVAPKIEEVTGKKLSNKEVIEFANKTAKVLHKVVTKETTQATIAANLNLRKQIALASQDGKMTPQLIEAIIQDKSAATDIARQLQARSINASPAERTIIGEILDGVLKASDDTDAVLQAARDVDFNDVQQATEFYRKFVQPRAEDWLTKLRYNSMLSSPNTHIVNASSNYQGSGILAPIEKTVAGTIDFLRSATTGAERTQFAGEGVEYAKGYYSNIREAAHRFADVITGKSLSTNPDVRNISLTTKPGIAQTTERALDIPMRLLEGMDQFFTAMTEGGAKRSLTYRVSKGVNVGNIGTKAAEEAQYRLFRGDLKAKGQGPILNSLDEVTKGLMNLTNAKEAPIRLIAKFTLPFLRTPMNLLKQGIEYSPLGISTIAGAGNKTEQLAKVIIGTSIGAVTATLLGSDRLSWAEPTNQKMKSAFRAAGKQAYSVKIGDTWVSYEKLHPAISFNLAMVASIKHAIDNKKLDESQANSLMNGLSQWVQFYADQSYLRNVGDFLAATKGDIQGPSRLASNYAMQVIPFRALMGWVNRLIDTTQRLPDSKNPIMKQFQYVATQIPGLSGFVPARKGPDGKVVVNTNPLLNAISPAKISTETSLAQQYEQMQETSRKNSLISQARDMVTSGETVKVGDTIVYSDADGTSHVLNTAKIATMPSSTEYEKELKSQAAFKLVDDVLNNLQGSQQDEALRQLGVSKEDAQYYNIARQTVAAKDAYISDILQDVKPEKLMATLGELRKEVNGKAILADGNIDTLYEQGIITYAEKKALKSLTFDKKTKTVKVKRLKAKKPKKPKKISIQKTSVKPVSFSKPRKARYRKLQQITFEAPKPLKVKKISLKNNYQKLFGL